MKKLLITAAFLCQIIAIKAQVKVWSGGAAAVGFTSVAPASGCKLQITGNSVFTSTTSSITSAAYIRGLNGYSTATTPDFTWWGNDQTGIFHPASNVMAFTVNGTERFRFNTAGFVIKGWSDVIFDYTSGGCCSTPTLFPNSDWYLQLGTSTKFIGDAYITHEIYKVAPSYYSDESVKQNINYDIDDAVSKLKLIKPVSYTHHPSFFSNVPEKRKQEYCTPIEYGVIAQDLQTIFPEMVQQDSASGLLSVQYNSFIALLIAGMQEQQEQIDSLKSQLNSCCPQGSGFRMNNNDDPQDKQETTMQVELANKQEIILYQNQPNPFDGSTIIRYFIPENINGEAFISFTDLYGKEIKKIEIKGKGFGKIEAGTENLASGIYSYSIIVNDKVIDTKKMLKNK